MRPIRIAIALIAAAGLAASSARAGTDGPPAYMERSERTVEPAGIRALDVDNSRGRVQLGASTDGRLHVVATKVCRMADPAEARRFASQATVETGVHDGRYVIRVHYPRRIESRMSFWDLFSERGRRGLRLPVLEVRLEILAPASLPASIATASGDVVARGWSGTLRLNSASGDLEAADMRGAIDAETASGDVTLHGVAAARLRSASGDLTIEDVASLDATTASGDVSVSGARGELVLESASGDIVVADAPAGVRAHTASGGVELRGACGQVDAETQSGDIRARLRPPLRGARATSGSGEIEIELVSGLAASIAARSVSGSIDCRVPVTVLGHDRNSLDARIGQGGSLVRLESTSGNVSIMSGGK